MTTKIWPIPEIIRGESYEVREAPRNIICTDLAGKLMFVPSEDSPFGVMGRLHEMGHVAITPADSHEKATAEGIEDMYLQVSEDMRLNRYLSQNFELDRALPEELLAHRIKGWVLEDDFKSALLFSVAGEYTPDGEFIKELIYSLNSKWSSSIGYIVSEFKDLLKEDHSFGTALQIARKLQDLFNFSYESSEGSKRLSPDEIAEAFWARKDIGEWGEMSIIEHPMPISTNARRLVRRVKPQDTGATMMFPSRLDVDDKIFGTMRKVAGGTILCDVSGSMSLGAEDIKKLMNKAPGATVAIYSGDGISGELQIIAKKGRMVDLEQLTYDGGNVVDGPALRWLALQAKPRIWVCDGAVTGRHDDSHLNLTLEAKDIATVNDIKRIEYIDEVVAFLAK